VAVVPGQHLAGREDFQVLFGGQRLVFIGVSVQLRVVGAAGFECRVRAHRQVAVGEFLEPLAGVDGGPVAGLRLVVRDRAGQPGRLAGLIAGRAAVVVGHAVPACLSLL